MIISCNLLAQFYPGIRNLTLDQISSAFFKIGIEVEGFGEIVAPEGLYYGIIRSCEKIGNSDRLNMCKVFIPIKNQTFDIVCGASNVREGLRVLAALPGAKLANGTVEIGERTFNQWGITSKGMLCSYLELYKHDLLKDIADFERGKIIEFGDNWDLNREFKSEDLWLDDWIFDLFIPANRGDLHSAWGLSRELAKVLGVSKEELGDGQIYSEDQDMWIIKRVLLVNNQRGIDKCSFEECRNRYLYLAFNEWPEGDSRLSRSKSNYFRGLRNALMSGQPKRDFSMRNIRINSFWVLGFVGLPLDWKYESDWFIFSNDFASVPEWREDIVDDEDVVGEIIGLLGWDQIEAQPIISASFRTSDNSRILAMERIREFWRNLGFYECTTFNLHRKDKEEVEMSNPLSKDHCSMRNHAINELIGVLEQNHRSKRELHPVFEIFESQYPQPTWKLNIVVPEISNYFPLGNTRITFSLCDLQAFLRRCWRYLNEDLHFSPESESTTTPFLKNKNNLSILDRENKVIGSMGILRSPISSVDLWGCILEIHWKPEQQKYESSSISKYPPVYKDISIAVNVNSNISLWTITRNMTSEHLVSWRLMEKHLSEESVNYLFRVKLHSPKSTLTGEDIRSNLQSLYSYFSGIEGVSVR